MTKSHLQSRGPTLRTLVAEASELAFADDESTAGDKEFENKHPIGSRIRWRWQHSQKSHYDGTVVAYLYHAGEHLIQIQYDDKHKLYHTTLDARQGQDVAQRLFDKTAKKRELDANDHDADGMSKSAYTPFEAPVVAPCISTEEIDDADRMTYFTLNCDVAMLCSMLGANDMKTYDDYFADASQPTLCIAEYQLYDIGTGDLVQTSMVTVTDGKKAVEVNLEESARWHEPKNEREYKASPQHARWRTAREFKMEQYEELHSWSEPISRKGIPRDKIMRCKWVNAIKRTIAKDGKHKAVLNPRLCIVGTGMSREVFKSFAQVARTSSIHILVVIFVTYMDRLEDIQMDDSNAFQATRTDTGSDQDKKRPALYTEMAPDFVEYDEHGKAMIRELLTSFQGRIDASYLYGEKKREILAKCGFHPMLWDPECYQYHNTSVTGTAASLDSILTACENDPPAALGHPPVGYAQFARHVDDKVGFQSKHSKIAQYLKEHPANVYACDYSPWRKVLGFEATIDRDERIVVLEARDLLERVKEEYLKEAVIISPKHVTSPSILSLTPGELPDKDDPGHAAYAEMQRVFAKGVGLGFWLGDKYPQIKWTWSMLGAHMHNGSPEAYKLMLYGYMHLVARPYARVFGGNEVRSLELPGIVKQPVSDEGVVDARLHYYCDANVGSPPNVKAHTGIVAMFGGVAIDEVSGRQQIKAGESHTTEVVAASTCIHKAMPQRGFIQESYLPQGDPTAFLLDSQTTIDVSNNDAASGRSLWLRRRIEVNHQAVRDGTITVVKVPEALNCADMHTKYLVHERWKRHRDVTLNLTDERIKNA